MGEADVGPPLFSAHAAGAAVVGVEFGLRAKGGFEGLVDFGGGDVVASEARVARRQGVLLGDGELGGEEGAKGIEAEEEVAVAGHCHIEAVGEQ